jgi:Icc protein
MSAAVRIAHISDLHLSLRLDRETIRRTRQVLSYIQRLGVDHTVITGDITANADPLELGTFRSLCASHGLLDPDRMSVVIGNHDIFGGVHLAEDVLSFPSMCKKAVYKEKVARFIEKLPELHSHCIVTDDNSPYPYLKPVGPVILVGLNSVARYSRLKNPFGSNGEIDDRQYEDLERLLAMKSVRKYPKVVLIHHHFSTHEEYDADAMHLLWSTIEQQTTKLRGKKRLMKLFGGNNVQFVLHGHVHRNSTYSRKGIRFVNGGGGLLGTDRSLLAVNVVTVGANAASVETHTFPAASNIPARHRHPTHEDLAPAAQPVATQLAAPQLAALQLAAPQLVAAQRAALPLTAVTQPAHGSVSRGHLSLPVEGTMFSASTNSCEPV